MIRNAEPHPNVVSTISLGMERWTKMLKKVLRFTIIGASALALAACGAGNGGAGDMSQNGYRTNNTGDGVGILGNRTNDNSGYGIHNNRNLQSNANLARAIERLDGISRANVVLGETNAYVAVEVEPNASSNPALGGNNARSSQDAQSFGMKGSYYGSTDSRVIPGITGHGRDSRIGGRAAASNRGTTEMYGYGTGGAANGGGLIGGGLRMNNAGSANGGKMQGLGQNGQLSTSGMTSSARDIGGADGTLNRMNAGTQGRSGGLSGRVGLNRTGINGFGANGVGGNGTGAGANDAGSRYMYNGGNFGQMSAYQNNYGLGSQIRARVEAIVRQHAPNVRNVYVSADPTFMQRMSAYGERLGGAGERGPLRAMMDEFNEFVGGIFAGMTDGGRATQDYDFGGYDERNRNGMTRQMDNSFDVDNPRHRTGMGMSRTPAGTMQSAR